MAVRPAWRRAGSALSEVSVVTTIITLLLALLLPTLEFRDGHVQRLRPQQTYRSADAPVGFPPTWPPGPNDVGVSAVHLSPRTN